MKVRLALLVTLFALTLCPAGAWKPARDTAGPLTVSIAEVGPVTALEKPVAISITLANAGAEEVKGTLRFAVTDRWRVEGENPRAFAVAAGKTAVVEVSVVAGKGTYAAHYPVHAFAEFQSGGEKLTAHAVLVCQAAAEAVDSRVAPRKGVERVVALRTAGPVQVDGDLGEWADAIPVPLGDEQGSVGRAGPGDFGAVALALHDATTLFLGLRVTDDQVEGEDITSRDFMNSDYVRLYLAPRSPRERKASALSAEDVVLAIAPFAGPKPLVKVPDYETPTRNVAPLSQVRVAARKTAAGYEAEIAVPLALIGPAAKEGASLGVNLMLGDADGGRREAEITLGRQEGAYWTSPACYAALELSPRTKDDGLVALPVNTIRGRGATPLDRLAGYRVTVAREGKPAVEKPLGWTGQDAESGSQFAPGTASRPDKRACITFHPPYRAGVGPFWADARFALPNVKPITLRFATAIRDNAAAEPPSDGVEWRVYVYADADAPEGTAKAERAPDGTISLELADCDFRKALSALAEAGRVRMVVPPDAATELAAMANVTIKIDGIDLEKILRILSSGGRYFSWRKENDTYVIGRGTGKPDDDDGMHSRRPESIPLFKRFSAGKEWRPATVDLSAYAGKTITLRLWMGPGPAGNTTCDSGFWGEPTLLVGTPKEAPAPVLAAARRGKALRLAQGALAGKSAPLAWKLESRAGTFGAGLVLGESGLADATLALTSADGTLYLNGFTIEVAGESLADWRSKAEVTKVAVLTGPTAAAVQQAKPAGQPAIENRKSKIENVVRHTVVLDDQTIPVDARLWVEGGALRVAFSMPGVKRDERGQPRFTNLGLGPADRKARRIYAGFGNVIEDPGRHTLGANGFGLSTSHVGADFEGGVSLVQASSIYPDRFEVDPEKRLYSLQTHHDATLSLVPSAKGAFAAARVYRDLSGFRPAGGVAKLQGKMCIDWWGGHDIADALRRAGAYGLSDSVFIKHQWQRWGYDYRLPDIYPPACDPKVWTDWVQTAKGAGMLVGVHDNYIDYYPDAEGFSYKHIVFNADGTPQRAWLHTGLNAQSYRWLPHAFKPFLVRNMKLIKDGFAPTASFVDVFTAHPLIDYYDEDGRFYTKMECAKGWGDCFDYIRETLGDNAPTTCEAGHDGLVGHVDGVQSDHYAAKHWNWKCADAERTPWHDMATHGSMVLLAGGLGPRYSGGEPYSGWDSDDYLSNTVMGGRNPMSQGPCTRGTVMTYWLQHDICRELARQSLETHEFVGDDIHRQHTTFGGGGQVWANRGTTPWKVGNTVLPRFGFLARSGQVTAEVSERDGIRTGYASSPGVTFVDARPFAIDFAGHAPVKTRVLSGKHLGGGQVECEVEWEVLQPVPQGNVIFVHVSHDKAVDQGSERIVLHPPMELPADALQRPGVHRGKIRFTLPANGWEGEYRLRYGLYSPTGGGRLMPIAYMDDSRVRGGIFTVTKKDGAYDVQYTPELPPADAPRQNLEGKVVNFGAITTNGAFRLLHAGSEWKLLPLQGSLPFRADLNLAGLGAKGRRLASVEGITQEGKPLGAVAFAQEGDVVKMDLDAKAFGYRLRLR